jgi:hypothetical protein
LGVLDADGINLGPDPDGMLADVLDQDAELVMPLADERWAWIPGLLGGRIFTHRLSAVEAEHDIIAWGPDLAPLSMLTECETYQRLTDGSPIADVTPFLDGDILAARGVPETAVDGDGVLLLQPRRFTTLGVAAGDLVGLRVTAHGFELAAVAELTPCDIGAALAALLEERPDRPEMLDVAVWTVCAGDASVFGESAAPLGDVLSASGLAWEGDWVARGGFDFGAWRVQRRIETIKVLTICSALKTSSRLLATIPVEGSRLVSSRVQLHGRAPQNQLCSRSGEQCHDESRMAGNAEGPPLSCRRNISGAADLG